MQINRAWKLLLTSVVALTLVGCNAADSSDRTENSRVEDQQQIYVDSQPVPSFDWSLERHLMTRLYEARNDAVVTYSYVRNLDGKVYFECESIGFPIPADTQLTNPNKLSKSYRGIYNSESTSLPQAEPNGLFTSQNTKGTFIFCLNEDGTVSPSYFEDDIETHLAPLGGGKSNLKIDIDRARQ